MPKVNQILYIQVASSDEEEAKIEYKSRIADVGENDILIEIPINEQTGRFKKLFLGDELSTFFITEGGMKNYFNTHVVGFKEDVIKLISIQKPDPDQVTKVQRRSFFRVNADLELAVTLSGQIKFLAVTDNIGGGGVSFIADGKYTIKSGDLLDCWLLLTYKNGSIDHVNFKCEIVRVKPLETGRNQVMCKFSDISDTERQKIIRFCFERQLDYKNR
nr:flagellar brake domain-containing protein [Paenibacillus abyssi]